MSKLINLEFILPVVDYFKSSCRNDLAWDFIPPLLIAGGLYSIMHTGLCKENVLGIISCFIQSEAIIFAFSIACATIFATSSNRNIEKAKAYEITHCDGMNLYRQLLASFVYALIMSVFCIIYSLFLYIFSLIGDFAAPSISTTGNSSVKLGILIAINIFLLLHVLFVSVRSMTSLYFILWKK